MSFLGNLFKGRKKSREAILKAVKKDRGFILEVVKQNGFALKYVDDSFKKDREIVLAAVKQAGKALDYADAPLTKDREIVLTAVKQWGGALKFADASLKKDKEVVLEAVKQAGGALQYADDSLKKDREIVLEAVKQDGRALQYADISLKKDREVVLEAVKQDQKGWTLQYADDSLKKDREVVLEAVKQRGSALQYADDSLKKDREVVLEAVKQDGGALKYADDSLKKDRGFMLEVKAIKQHSLIPKKPKNVDSINNLLNLNKSKFQQSQNLAQLKEAQKKQIELLNNQGLKFLEQKKYMEALNCFNKALIMKPNNVMILNHKGLVFYEQDKCDEAINCYNQVLNIDAENIFALHNKGNALSAQEKNQEAILCFDGVLKKQPNDVDALNNKGLVLHEEEQYIEAIECYDLGLKFKPHDSGLLKNRDSARRELKKVQTQAKKTILEASFIISYKELTIDKSAQLGAGGFGAVYKGTWQFTSVAIKQLLIPQMTERGLQSFKQEATVMAKLRHPNVLPLYGICIEPGHYCMVMKYMPNGSLYGFLHSAKQFTWPQKWKVAIGISKGLLQLHSKDIFHRDLTSHNVLLGKSFKPKICDFGLSAVKQESKTSMYTNQPSQEAVGKTSWMAPELFLPNAKYTKACDMYSLGMVLWELAARKLPFANAQMPVLIMQWVAAGTRETIPQKCPPSFAKLIKWCWEGEPKKRPVIEDAIKILQNNQHEALAVK